MISTHSLAIGDTPFAVHTRGSGIPLLLLHAFPLDHGMWEAQEPLAESVRIIAPDQRGFGGTLGEPPIASLAAWPTMPWPCSMRCMWPSRPLCVECRWAAMSPSMLPPGTRSECGG